jgi:hypothetical protein
MLVLAPMSARLVERLGTKLVLGTGLLVVALALALQTTLDTGSSTLHVVLVTIVLAAGMANVMAPATESIMGSLPRAKAGVGSAVNDTTRQMGGAIGVALIGSLLASVYRSDVRTGLAGSGAPASLVEQASSSVQSGVAAGRELGGALGQQVVTVSHQSFVSGYHVGVVVAAAVVLVAAVAVFRWLPARAVAADAGVVPAGAADDLDAVGTVPDPGVEPAPGPADAPAPAPADAG